MFQEGWIYTRLGWTLSLHYLMCLWSLVRSFIVLLNEFTITLFNVLIKFSKIARNIQDPFTHHLKLSFILYHFSEKFPMACHTHSSAYDRKFLGIVRNITTDSRFLVQRCTTTLGTITFSEKFPMACHTQSSACNRKFLEIVRRGHIYITADSVLIVPQCTTT